MMAFSNHVIEGAASCNLSTVDQNLVVDCVSGIALAEAHRAGNGDHGKSDELHG